MVPLDRAAEAYDLSASDATFGKVILDCAEARGEADARTRVDQRSSIVTVRVVPLPVDVTVNGRCCVERR